MDISSNATQPLWQRRWFQVLLAVLLGLVVLSFIVPPIFAVVYALRSILTPVLIGLGLAYVVNPVITYADVRYRIPRWAGTAGVMAVGALMVAVLLLLVVPPLVGQGADLILKLKDVYPRELIELIGEPLPAEPASAGVGMDEAPEPGVSAETPDEPPAQAGSAGGAGGAGLSLRQRLADPQERQVLLESLAQWLGTLDWATISAAAARSLDIGVGVVGSAISFTTYLLLAVVIIAFCFFYFAWKFSQITGWFAAFIPASQRGTVLPVIRQMDRSVNAFIRGRLVQAMVMMAVLSVGWWIVGVPYWLLLGVLSGLLNLVPFLAVIGWVFATVLTVVDHTTGVHGFTLWTLLGPTLVYLAAQTLDGWVVEPVVQGKATNLDPLSVLLVVMIGASLAGLFGMLLAIPVAACIKIAAKEVVLPRLRALAAEN